MQESNELLMYSSELSEYDDVTTKELKGLGYSKYRIKKLSSGETPILIRTRRGHYIFNKDILAKIDSLFRIDEYRRLINEGKYSDAINFIFPNDIQYFSGYDYLFLYLLRYRVEVPEQLRPITKSLNIEEVFNNPNNKDLRELDEKVRMDITKNLFGYANWFLSKKNKSEKNLKVENITLKKLLLSIKNKQRENNKNTPKISKENYNTFLVSLDQASKQRSLTKQEVYIAKLITIYLEIEKSRIIPKEMQTENASFFENIDNNCFESALKQSKRQIYSTLLQNILLLIHSIEKEQKIISKIDLEDILVSLTLKETTKSFRLINYYLREINREEYLKLILELIKISYIENDVAFTVPMRILINLKNNTLDIKPDIYLSKFNEALNSRSINEASTYLSVLTELERLGLIDNINIEELNDKLKKAKGTKFDPENRSHLKTISSIMVRDCLSLEETCTSLSLDRNTRNIVFLMFAKEYYYLSDFKNGDELVKIVEREEDKSDRVKQLFNEIRRDKNFYKNRTEEMGVSLILVPNI